MFSKYEEIISCLLRHKLICKRQIVENGLAIIDVSRRHCNFKVMSLDGPCYFLKKDIRDKSQRKPATVGHEADVYELFQSICKNGTFSRYLPHLYTFDPKDRFLILEAISGTESLAEYHSRRGYFPSIITKKLGKALAELHEIFKIEKERIEEFQSLPVGSPWALYLPQPGQWIYLNSSSANIEFVRILQKCEELCSLLDEVRLQWRTDTLIHYDLKWDNCLVGSTQASPLKPTIHIVDWELACIGDPCWDLGTFFSQYLNFWLSSIPISGNAPPEQFLDFARFPLSKMHASIRSFWNAYIQHLDIGPNAIENKLMRATKFAGVRLVQTAFEDLQNEANITSKAICLLQLCLNILKRPIEAAVQLLGLPLPEGPYNEEEQQQYNTTSGSFKGC